MNWDLGKLYAGFDDPKFLSDMTRLQENIAATRAHIAALRHNDDGADLTALLKALETITALETKTGEFAGLTVAADADNQPARAAYDRIMELDVDLEQMLSAFQRYTGEIADLDKLLAETAALAPYAYYLKSAQRAARHALDPAIEEPVLRMQLTGGTAWERLRDDLDASLLIDIELDGKTQTLPLSAIRGLACSADAATRKKAYEAELAAYPRIEIPMAACLNGIKGEALTMSELRNYPSVLDFALDVSHMDHATLDALIAAMKESLPMFRRYFRLKAKALGYDGGLKFYDLFAPLGQAGRKYTLAEARSTLVSVMGKFSARMAQFIDHAFADHWIDAYPHKGKQGGAFCAGVHPLGISYVLTNFEGSLDSVSTIAHELGHAYHNDNTKTLSILNADYPMPLAETASIFNETLLTQKLLADADDAEKLLILDQEIGNAAQVIVDILSRYLFESEVISRRKDHALSPAELNAIMLDAQKATYGDGLAADAMHPYMWACKSHYYSTGYHFYNFPYAFGLLFGKGVYAQYLARGDAFLPEYDALLRATGLGDVRDVAAGVGIDVADIGFWRESLRVVEKAIDEMAELVEN